MTRITPPGGSPGPKSWWVIKELSGVPRSPGVVAYVSIQFPSRTAAESYALARPGGEVAAGPFDTKTNANNWIDQKQHLPKGTDPSLPEQIKNTGPKIPNPLSGIDRIGAVLEAFFRIISDGTMWRSLGWIVLGLLMLIYGLAAWAKKAGLPVPTAIPVPV